MKVAIIGVGRWGKILLGEVEKQAEVLYICSKTAGNTEEAFLDKSVEAVFIATPTQTHFEVATKALEAGKHVFLEKPGTTNSADLEKLVKLAETKQLKFAIGYEYPHHPGVKKLKELITGKKIRSIHLSWQKWGTFHDNAVFHLLCHDVSIVKHLGFENLSPINYQHTKVISDTDVISVIFENTQGVHIKSIINRISPNKQKTITVLTEDGGYILSNAELFEINKETQALDKIALPDTTSVAEEIKDFLSSISENHEPLCNGDFALEVYKTIEKVK